MFSGKLFDVFASLLVKQIQPIEEFTKLLFELFVSYFPQSQNSSGISEREWTILTIINAIIVTILESWRDLGHLFHIRWLASPLTEDRLFARIDMQYNLRKEK
jgi:hypothetical protein